MISNHYFEKAENGTTYRVYLQDFAGRPSLIRSALDAADGVHGDLVNTINEVVDQCIEMAIEFSDDLDKVYAAGRKYISKKMLEAGFKECC